MANGINLTKISAFNGEGIKSPAQILSIFQKYGLATQLALKQMRKNPKNLARFYALFNVNQQEENLSFAPRFKNLKIEGLDRENDPQASFFSRRFLLESMGCAFAYHKAKGLTIVTTQEKEGIARGEIQDFQLELPKDKLKITCGTAAKAGSLIILPDNIEKKEIEAVEENIPGTALVPAEDAFLSQISFVQEKALSPFQKILGRLAPKGLFAPYRPKLTQIILLHIKNREVKEAAFLLFRDQTAANIISFIEKNKVHQLLSEKLTREHSFLKEELEYDQLRKLGLVEPLAREMGLNPASAAPDAVEKVIKTELDILREEISDMINRDMGLDEFLSKESPEDTRQTVSLLTETEAVLSYLLLQIEPPLVRAIFSAHFIESLKNTPSACRILWGMGHERHEGKPVIYYVLSALILRKKEEMAHVIIKEGLNHVAYHTVYAEALNELKSDLHPGIYSAEEYLASPQQSLFKGKVPKFFEPGLIPQNTFYYQALLSPRLLYREIARRLCARGEYKQAWSILGEGLEPEETFNELLGAFPADRASIGAMIHVQGRSESAAFIARVYKALPGQREELAHVLLHLYEDKKDLAAFFVYMIRPEKNIKEKRVLTGELREAAYGLLFLGATAFEEANERLQDEYISLLLEIESRYYKSDPDFLSAETFLKEGRLVKSDPPSAVRKEQLTFYMNMLKDDKQTENNRIYAAEMLGRMGSLTAAKELIQLMEKEISPEFKNTIRESIEKIGGEEVVLYFTRQYLEEWITYEELKSTPNFLGLSSLSCMDKYPSGKKSFSGSLLKISANNPISKEKITYYFNNEFLRIKTETTLKNISINTIAYSLMSLKLFPILLLLQCDEWGLVNADKVLNKLGGEPFYTLTAKLKKRLEAIKRVEEYLNWIINDLSSKMNDKTQKEEGKEEVNKARGRDMTIDTSIKILLYLCL